MIIDSHHHFWKYNPKDYGWIDESMSAIARDFLPDDLLEETRAAGVHGVVSVQARQTIEETNWLLGLAEANHFIRGVVGWLPLAGPDLGEHLDAVASHPKLKAIRHVLQDEPDDDFILGDAFNAGVAQLESRDLAYDILVGEHQLPQVVDFVDRHPAMRFVLDHIAKPMIAVEELEPWKKNIARLAERPNVYCKLSGMVTEADWGNWTPEQLRPYFDAVLDAFGPERLMFGSDWPVCLLACEYANWLALVKGWAIDLSHEEKKWLFGGTAAEAYQLHWKGKS